MVSSEVKASVIIPARDAMATIGKAIESVLIESRGVDVEIIIVNDGLDHVTAKLADHYPVRVIPGNGGGIASARNIGMKSSQGEILIFLDADCRVKSGWLQIHLKAHKRFGDLLAVGGSICMEPNAPFWARCDHFCSWYNVNPGLKASWVPNHPCANLSIRRPTLKLAGPFQEDLPLAGVNEEAKWQSRLRQLGGGIRFEPRAAVFHTDRDEMIDFIKHNYWWAYNSITVKHQTGISRFPWVFKRPWILVAGFIPFAVFHTLYTIVCWLRAGRLEPLAFGPFIFLGRLAYAIGMVIGRLQTIRK
jgi:glycosyltransferase involved in cell wall biosynthesis